MVKKDNEKDSERPHYYSQFWLDVAAGRRIIGAPKEEGEGDASVATAAPKASPASEDTHEEEEATSSFETVDQADAYAEPEEEFASDTYEEVVDADVPDVDIAEEEEEDEDEEGLYEEEEEDEDEEEWGGRSRKKSKPTRAVKPTKKPRRETRRGF
ncbi:hypothetical protein [Ktedonospora formicarum]|uniref:Uncharacterized protein n=1 Tax=Ktedonospora formicarum TaxID=2778364 RepID=A0A8J3I1C1_9CHLR|nr:hypothetical protein [Ktedonospora formicarum]GHO43104.1 hypothetical protein KSX_12670 [Ktedonospora formicarum]